MPSNSLSLSRLLLAERNSLLRRIGRIVGRDDAEDVAQKVWLKVQNVRDDPPISNERAYLFRLATNLALDHAKAGRHHNELFGEAALSEEMADESPLADKVLLDREALDLVHLAILELSPRCRNILHMRRVEGLSTSEIASLLGISRQMVTRYIAQAIAHCLDRLGPD